MSFEWVEPYPYKLLLIPLFLLCSFACAVVAAGGETQQENSAWDQVLAAAGLTRATCHFDLLDSGLFGSSDFTLPYFKALHEGPLRIPFHARLFRQNVLALASRPGELVGYGSARIGAGTRLTLLGDPLAEFTRRSTIPGALLNAIAAISEAAGAPLTGPQRTALKSRIAVVPPDVQAAASLLLYTEKEAYLWRQKALSSVAATHNLQKLFNKLVQADSTAGTGGGLDPELEMLMHHIDMPRLMVGAEYLALGVDRAAAALRKRAGTEKYAFDWDTPLGHIALHGAQNDTYPGNIPYLLMIDTGGDDTYYGGGGSFDASHPVSVLIDTAGNDRYLASPELIPIAIENYPKRKKGQAHPCFGAGILGYGILYDLEGNDLYRAVSHSLGWGSFGLGLLVDWSGNDTYDIYTYGQGAADFGVGILADLGGQDSYHCFMAAQGYGGTMGFGLLCNIGPEDDIYTANDTVIDFPSPQTAEHNASLAQGMGFGLRADYIDGHSLAGGIGALVVEGGNNHFSAGLFAQGAGYWEGLGILSSGPGNDTYQGVWYVQGSAAHWAVGILHDTGGDDHYRASMNMAQGAGHDYSVGFLMDDAGNDRYEAPNLSLGSGNANGFGFFWDKAGNNTYMVHPSLTLGSVGVESTGAGSIRERDLTLGIFLDTGGKDTYPAEIPGAHDNTLWTNGTKAPNGHLPSARGAGLDTEAPDTPDPW